MTKEQREKVNDAFDILLDVYKELNEEKGKRKESKKLDVILNKIENLLWLR